MSRYKFSFLVIILISIFLICGCAVRTYKVTKIRVDQEVAGNRGYLSGQVPSAEVKPKSTMRETYVMEVEFGTPAKYQRLSQSRTEATTMEKTQITTPEEDFLTEETEIQQENPAFKTYKVTSGDTLQKISKQFYGTYKKWQKIYEANKDKIANANKIKPGTILNIPE